MWQLRCIATWGRRRRASNYWLLLRLP